MKRRGKRTGLQFAGADEDEEEDVALAGGGPGAGDTGGLELMDEDEDEDEDEAGEEFESEWEFFPLHDADWHAAKQHVARLLDGRAWDAGDLAALLAETQRDVGSAIKIGERDTQALGVGAVLSFRAHGQRPSMRAVRDFVLERAAGAERAALLSALETGNVGLFVNERVLNLPPLVALHLHLALFEELQTARATQPEYALTHLLLVTLAYRESRGDKSAPGDAKRVRDREDPVLWFRPEEEIYARHASVSLMWPVTVNDQASRWTFDGRVAQFKVVLLVPIQAIQPIASRMHAILEGDYGDEE